MSDPFLRFTDTALTLLFQASRAATLFTPHRLLFAVYRRLARVAMCLRPSLRARLVARLTRVLDHEASPRELAKDIYAAALFPMLDLVCFGRRHRAVLDRLVVEGWNHLEQADAAGKGVILATGHLGGFVLLTPILSHLEKPTIMTSQSATASGLPRYSATATRYALRLGALDDIELIWVDAAFKHNVHEALRQGSRVLMNQDVGGGNDVIFLGARVSLAAGVALLSHESGAPIVPTYLLRGAKDPLALRLVFEPPLWPEAAAERSAEMCRIQQALATSLSDRIARDPAQWMSWFALDHWLTQKDEESS
ncbi:MAG: lysophospholipid acyltransferase family protein [Candidatus Geothermincolia bacterium]